MKPHYLLKNLTKLNYLYSTRRLTLSQRITLFTKKKSSNAINFCLPATTIIVNNSKYCTNAEFNQSSPQIKAETLFNSLNSYYQINGYVKADTLNELLESVERDDKLSKEQIEFLLTLCNPIRMPTENTAVRKEFFERLWNVLKTRNHINKELCHIKLQIFKDNRVPLTNFRQILQEYEENGCTTSTPDLYSKLLRIVCESGNIQQALEILTEMRNKNFALAEADFNSLILGHARSFDINNSYKILDSMTAAGLSASSETQTMLIIAHLENNDIPKAKEILHKYHGQFSAAQIFNILRSCLIVDFDFDLEFISQLILEIPKLDLIGPEVPTALKSVCIEMIHNKKLPVVLKIISTLPNPEFNINQNTDTFGNFLLHHMFAIRHETEGIIEASKLLKDSGKNERALHVATEIAMKRNPPVAVEFFKSLSTEEPLRPHYFWPLLIHNFRKHGESGIIRTLKIMSTLQVTCDEDTIIQYILPKLSIMLNEPAKAIKLLQNAGLKSSHIMPIIIEYLITQDKLEEVFELSELYLSKFDMTKLIPTLSKQTANVRAKKRYFQFAKMLSSLLNRNENPKVDIIGQLLIRMLATQGRIRTDALEFLRFIRQMHKHNLKISPTAVNVIQSYLKQFENDHRAEEIQKTLKDMTNKNYILSDESEKSFDLRTSSFAKHPRDMSLDELECHLIELETKKLNTRGVLRRLLQLCVRDNRLERALEIKTKCDQLNVDISPGMLASVFDMYIKLKDLPKAKMQLEKLKKTFPGFQIDEHKIIDYAALLVHDGELDVAKKLLEQRSETQKIFGGDYVLKNVWNFLTNVANIAAQISPPLAKEENITKENFEFLKKLGYCKIHNTLLGPIVREYLLRRDLRSAIEEFKKLAQRYRHTPLQFEILSLLVRLGNADSKEFENYAINVEDAQTLLREVISTVTSVHGQTNLNSALILAFAESGTDNQLRRLMLNPEFHINEELLHKNCEHLGQEGAVSTLMRLARASRNLRTIDEQSIYNMLLNKFVSINNYSGALDLYECLEADDELKISQEFLQNLVKLLKYNNVNVPSNLALRAQVI
ncbi:leucine-rich PPR motif-containing protein, mitochondrial [Teleopsis dalmanni]|uniref:leucine-rich PPR motif-containing protein, mitochondrial n=1 Tax=Teleopsis dalmanni TaxID=139649 RepID=UPI0018CE3B3A|nr:leucine-rich PPR motif-containing protein, mitochondrial [Teleopsis dalmanni]